jgi:hypothetical protein
MSDRLTREGALKLEEPSFAPGHSMGVYIIAAITP